jgi:hypothetical protein
MTRMTISRVGGWMSLVYLLAFFLPFLWIGIRHGDGGALVGAFLGGPWIAVPVMCAATLIGASPTRLGATIFLLLELGLICWTGSFMINAYSHGNSTAAIGLFILPAIQLFVVAVAFTIALACGWRMRPDFLKDPS